MFVYKLLWSALCIAFSHGDPFMMTNRPPPWRYLYDTWAPSNLFKWEPHFKTFLTTNQALDANGPIFDFTI